MDTVIRESAQGFFHRQFETERSGHLHADILGKETFSGGAMPQHIVRDRSIPFQFRSLPELIRNFENSLSIQEIERVILETGQLFTYRGKETDAQERSTFLNRCHRALQGSLLLRKEELFGILPKTRA